MTQRVCFLLQVRPEQLAEYRERHRTVWPEMRDLFDELEGQRPDERMRPLEEVFHLP